jgi:hypothetical protein
MQNPYANESTNSGYSKLVSNLFSSCVDTKRYLECEIRAKIIVMDSNKSVYI